MTGRNLGAIYVVVQPSTGRRLRAFLKKTELKKWEVIDEAISQYITNEEIKPKEKK